MTPTEMTASDLRALARLVDDHKVVVVRHENLLAVLRPSTPDAVSLSSTPTRSPSSAKVRC